jgi:hypothetical protein
MEDKYQGMACAEYEVLLEDFVNGELGGAGAKTLAEHLKNCGGCQSAFQDAEAGARLLRLAEPTPDPGPGFARVVMARIRAEKSAAEGKSLWQPFVSVAWRFAATAALVLVALTTYDVSGHIWQQSDATNIQPGDLFSTDSANPPQSRDDVLRLVAESNHGKQ